MLGRSRDFGLRCGGRGGGTGVGLLRPREAWASSIARRMVAAAVAAHGGLLVGGCTVMGVMGSGTLDALADGLAPALCVAKALAAVAL